MARALSSLGAVGLSLILVPAAYGIAPSFTWAGRSTTSEEWSFPANWEGDEAPEASTKIEDLNFPRLTSTACTLERNTHPCYFSTNDLHGLAAESITIDDGDPYFIEGEPLALGTGGLSASPASGASGAAGDFMFMPLQLSAPQKWSIAERSSSAIEENGLILFGTLNGSSALSVELSDGPALILANKTEVGPVTLDGADAAGEHIDNGSVLLEEGELNSSDQQAVDLSHIFFAGSGAVGALTTDASTIDVGSDTEPAKGLEASSVKLDSNSGVLFEIMGSGATAQTDYSQLVSSGPVELAGSLLVVVGKPTEKASCPVLTPGATYTLVSTTGKLTGTFANAAEGGPEIAIAYAKSCARLSQTMRISYARSGGTETVTGTVEAASKQRQEEEAATKKLNEEEAAGTKKHEEELKREEAIKKLAAELARKAGEEAATVEAVAKRKAEEEAAGVKKRQEEAAAKGGVLGVKEASPDAAIANASLQASASGAVSIKVSCPAGVSSCAGTVTLRTLDAVSASVAGAAKAKPAVLTLASGSFKLPGGEVKLFTLHLSAKARALLTRSHTLRVRATIVAHNPAGATHTGQRIATLRGPRSKHG